MLSLVCAADAFAHSTSMLGVDDVKNFNSADWNLSGGYVAWGSYNTQCWSLYTTDGYLSPRNNTGSVDDYAFYQKNQFGGNQKISGQFRGDTKTNDTGAEYIYFNYSALTAASADTDNSGTGYRLVISAAANSIKIQKNEGNGWENKASNDSTKLVYGATGGVNVQFDIEITNGVITAAVSKGESSDTVTYTDASPYEKGYFGFMYNKVKDSRRFGDLSITYERLYEINREVLIDKDNYTEGNWNLAATSNDSWERVTEDKMLSHRGGNTAYGYAMYTAKRFSDKYAINGIYRAKNKGTGYGANDTVPGVYILFNYNSDTPGGYTKNDVFTPGADGYRLFMSAESDTVSIQKYTDNQWVTLVSESGSGVTFGAVDADVAYSIAYDNGNISASLSSGGINETISYTDAAPVNSGYTGILFADIKDWPRFGNVYVISETDVTPEEPVTKITGLTAQYSESVVTGRCEVANTALGSGVSLVAIYDGSDNLINVYMTEPGVFGSFDYSVTAAVKPSYAKAFAWEALGTLKPKCESVKTSVSE